ARGRPRPAPGGHGAQHRGLARAALKEVLFYFQGLDADAKLAAIHALRILVILALAWVLQAIAARLIRVFRSYMARRSGADEASRTRRTSTGRSRSCTRSARRCAAIRHGRQGSRRRSKCWASSAWRIPR